MPGERLALGLLVGLAVLTPWASGGVHPAVVRALSALALLTGLGVVTQRATAGRPLEIPAPAWPLAGLLLLPLLQCLPLPAALHALVAPGSAVVWYPEDPVAAAVLGPGPHPVSIHPGATGSSWALGLGIASLAALVIPGLRDREAARRAARAIVVGGMAVGIYGLLARIFLGDRLFGIFPVPTVAPFGPFVSKNHFAGYMELVALLALGLAAGAADEARRGRGFLGWTESRQAGRVVLSAGAAVVAMLTVGVSLSRGGVVSLVFGLLAFAVLRGAVHGSRERRRTLARAALAAAVLAPLLLGVLPAAARDRMLSLAGITSDSSGSYRLGVWADTLSLARTSPVLGYGFGAFADALPRFKRGAGLLRVEHAENDYLELLAECGIAALLLLLGAIGMAAREIVRGLANQPDRLLRGIGLGAASGLSALLVHTAFDFNLRIPSNAFLFALCAALALAAAGVQGTTLRRRGLGAAALVLTWGLATTALPPQTPLAATWNDLHAHARRPAATPLRAERAAVAARAALHARPSDAEAWLLLAWTRAAVGRPVEAQALARHALWLDPQRESLQREAARLLERRAPSPPGELIP